MESVSAPVDEKGDRLEEDCEEHQGHQSEQQQNDPTPNESDSDSDTEMLRNMASMNIAEEGPGQHKGTGFIYDELFTRHKCEWDSGYPECPARVSQPVARCRELGLVERCVQTPIAYATEDQIQWHHSLHHLELAKETYAMSQQQRMELAKKFDAWFANEATFESSLAAAGSGMELMDQILQKKVTNGFAMVRPPGHHAMHDEFCGFCVFNNAALATTHALNHGMERILIVDWDVHHGQATQYMFYNDPRVMYFSIHRYEHGEFWPNLRESDYDHIGEGKGRGYNVNVPLNTTGLGDSDFMAVMQQVLMPLAYEFSPQVVIISSGYDAAIGCPEGEMMVSPAAYAHFIHMLSALCEGRLCTLLEGGYCLQSLTEGCAMTLRGLLGDPCPLLPPMAQPSDSIISSILNIIKVLRPHWRCFDTFESLEGDDLCPFEDVNTLPPREHVDFSTKDNRPSEFEITDCYPVQSQETRDMYREQINQLIAHTSLDKAPRRTCFVFDATMRKHKNPFDSTHPERPNRISRIFEKHREWGLLNRCLQLESRSATEEEILTVHGAEYLAKLKETTTLSDEELRPRMYALEFKSIYLCQDTYESARLSAGCLLQVTEAVLSGKAQNGVAVIRPPGHHAECNEAMGFCFFNNVALAAALAKTKFGIKRILILDWDVHHGNATQRMFYSDPSVLYISLHRFDRGFFPGFPEAGHEYVGENEGRGFNVNIPWTMERMGNAEYMAAFQRIVMPIAYEFAPELVLVSAGFDAAAGDYLGGYRVTPECYGHMTHMLSSLANGRVILALEGGYSPVALPLSMATCTSVLLGNPCPPLAPGIPNYRAIETIQKVLRVQKEFWKSLKFAVKIPSVESETALLSTSSSERKCGSSEVDNSS
ncbi:protein deacetylase HDAC6-like [Babylonia areolata]|uniref:protein deacetylase HDAC6-like n=1 Tax=Babylonia areolata TaxID=304850 RepID=UPI003FD20557